MVPSPGGKTPLFDACAISVRFTLDKLDMMCYFTDGFGTIHTCPVEIMAKKTLPYTPLDAKVCHVVDAIETIADGYALRCSCGKYHEMSGEELAGIIQRSALEAERRKKEC